MKQSTGRNLASLFVILILSTSPAFAQGLITTVAGSTWTFPASITPATTAPLGPIRGVAVDASGNVYACDISNRRVVKISGTTLTVVAGNGFYGSAGDGGPATSASMTIPLGVAVDSSNNLYIADALNHVIRKVVPGANGQLDGAADEIITTVAGTREVPGSTGDNGPATSARLNLPSGVAVSGTDLYIADTLNHLIRKVASGTITTVAGDGTTAVLNEPSGVAVSGANLYIADTLHHIIQKVPTAGGTPTRVAGTTGVTGIGGDGGPATSAFLNNPLGVWVAGTDIYIADTFNNRVRMFTDGGNIIGVAGSGTYGLSGDGASALLAALASPSGVAVSGTTVYIADTDNKRVRSVISGTIDNFAGNGNFKYGGDGGAATSASLNFPNGVAAHVDAFNNVTLYIADTNNHRIRQVNSSGTISTLVNTTGQFGFTSDIPPVAGSTAKLNAPGGVALDASGNNLYIADTFNHRIRKVNLLAIPPTITTVAGSGTAGDPLDAGGLNGDNNLAINGRLNQPTGVALDVLGNIYIADKNDHRIRKVTTGGIITTVAGDGTTAVLNQPTGVVVDAAGTNVYIADTLNHRIRKLTGGTLSTIAGTGTAGFADGAALTTARFDDPTGVAVDLAGNVYIADRDNHRLRKLTGATVGTVAGTGSYDYSGDGGPATNASIATPIGVGRDVLGNVYIADTSNDRIRKLFAGFVTSGSAQGPPGVTASIAITLSLFGGATVDSVAFGLKLIPNVGPPPALSSLLTFSSSIGTPSVTTATASEISVGWTSLATPLSGAITLGNVVVNLPGTAADAGKTWTIQITGASASLAGAGVPLVPGTDATLTLILRSYVVGDSSPLGVNLNPGTGLGLDNDRDDAGEFGDGVLTIQDLIAQLRATVALDPPPPSCSDRFDAMDSDPVVGDVDADPNTRGGDGSLTTGGTQDLIVLLRRVTFLDTTRPTRPSRAITPCP